MRLTEKVLNNIKTDKNFKPESNLEYPDIATFFDEKLINVNRIDLLAKLDIPQSIGYKYLKGERKIDRNTLLKILIYLQFDLEEVNQTLKTFGFAELYSRNQQDSALIYAIYNKYSYQQLKGYLAEHNINQL